MENQSNDSGMTGIGGTTNVANKVKLLYNRNISIKERKFNGAKCRC